MTMMTAPVFVTKLNKRCSGQRGVTLIELMVAMAMTFIVVAAVFSVYSATWKNYRGGEAQTEAQQYARIAIERITMDVRQAARISPLYTSDKGTGSVDVSALLPSGCCATTMESPIRTLGWNSATQTLTYSANFLYMAKPMTDASGNVRDALNANGQATRDNIPDGYEFFVYYIKLYTSGDQDSYDPVNNRSFGLLRYKGGCKDANEDGICDTASYSEGGADYWWSSSAAAGNKGIKTGGSDPVSSYIQSPSDINNNSPPYIFTLKATPYAAITDASNSIADVAIASGSANPPVPGIYDISITQAGGVWTASATALSGGPVKPAQTVENNTPYSNWPVDGVTMTTATLTAGEPPLRVDVGYDVLQVNVDLTVQKRTSLQDTYRTVRLKSTIDIRN